MKPCDCKSIKEAQDHLNEQGIRFNDQGIEVIPNYVLLTLGHTQIKISMNRFKQFAEWYLEDQVKEKPQACSKCGQSADTPFLCDCNE